MSVFNIKASCVDKIHTDHIRSLNGPKFRILLVRKPYGPSQLEPKVYLQVCYPHPTSIYRGPNEALVHLQYALTIPPLIRGCFDV